METAKAEESLRKAGYKPAHLVKSGDIEMSRWEKAPDGPVPTRTLYTFASGGQMFLLRHLSFNILSRATEGRDEHTP